MLGVVWYSPDLTHVISLLDINGCHMAGSPQNSFFQQNGVSMNHLFKFMDWNVNWMLEVGLHVTLQVILCLSSTSYLHPKRGVCEETTLLGGQKSQYPIDINWYQLIRQTLG